MRSSLKRRRRSSSRSSRQTLLPQWLLCLRPHPSHLLQPLRPRPSHPRLRLQRRQHSRLLPRRLQHSQLLRSLQRKPGGLVQASLVTFWRKRLQQPCKPPNLRPSSSSSSSSSSSQLPPLPLLPAET